MVDKAIPKTKKDLEQEELEAYMVDDCVYFVVHANVPYNLLDKYYDDFLVEYFYLYLKNEFKVIGDKFVYDNDGSYFFLHLDSNDPFLLKQKTVKIEETHPLGRLIDIDVYHNSQKSIRREDAGLKLRRKCFICDRDSYQCRWEKTHTDLEYSTYIQTIILNFLKGKVQELSLKAMIYELDLEPKFGLVTKTSQGSHPDMDYNLMKKSAYFLSSKLKDYVTLGFETKLSDNLYPDIKNLGKKNEKELLENAGGINTYKGLHFLLGYTVTAFGFICSYNVKLKDRYRGLIDKIKISGQPLFFEFLGEPKTTGEKLFKSYGILGARGEVFYGLRTAQRALRVLEKYGNLSNEALTMALIEIVRSTTDTVLFARAKTEESYHHFKDLITSIKVYDETRIKEVTEECIKNNISIGGSADILVVAIFLYLLREEFFGRE